jgi:hypothetical protein
VIAAVESTRFADAVARPPAVAALATAWAADASVREAIRANLHEGTWWFGQEELEELVAWMVALVSLEAPAREPAARALGASLVDTARECGYQLDRWIARLTAPARPPTDRAAAAPRERAGPAPDAAGRAADAATGAGSERDAPREHSVRPRSTDSV